MAKGDDPKQAKDGKPKDDGGGKVANLEDRRKTNPTGGENGQSAEERAAAEVEQSIEEQEDGQFAIGEIGGENVTLGRIIKSGLPIKVEVAMMSAAIPGKDGLLDPNNATLLAVEVEVAKYEPIPIRERKQGQSKIVGWTIRQHMRVVGAARAESAEGRSMLGLPAQAVGG